MNEIVNIKQEASYNFDKVYIFGLLMAAAFSKWYVFQSIALGDILLVLGLLVFIVHLLNGKFRLRIYSTVIFLVSCLCMWALIGSLLISQTSELWFSMQEFFNSFVKLVFYAISALFVASYLSYIPRKVIEKVLINVVFLNAIIAIYIQVVMNFNLNLPYKFFWFGQPEQFISNAYYRMTDMAVAKGVFPEASLLGIFLNLGLTYLYCFRTEQVKHEIWKIVVIIIAIFLSLSFTAYALLVVNMLLFLIKRNKLKLTIACLFLVTLIFIFIFVSNITIARQLIKRTKNVVLLGDSSANARLIGSWEPAVEIIKKSPLFGSRLGNFENARKTIKDSWIYVAKTAEFSCFNSIAYVLGALGVVGFSIFFLLIGDLIAHNWIGGVMLFVTMFAHGNFLAPSLWIFYALFRAGSINASKGFEMKSYSNYFSLKIKEMNWA